MLIDGFNINGSHPILEPALAKVGMHFQAHKKHRNVFQILYVNDSSQ